MNGSEPVVFVWVWAAVTGVLRRPIGGVGSRRLVLQTLYELAVKLPSKASSLVLRLRNVSMQAHRSDLGPRAPITAADCWTRDAATNL